MNAYRQTNTEQSMLWNGLAGRAWVDARQVLDRLFLKMEDMLVEAVSATCATAVLDIGCGTGSTTLAVARRLGTRGRCVGVDISDPMITAARRRAASDGTGASFLLADAQMHTFEPASFDMIISRFGVMFFEDAVRAFKNLRTSVKDGGELRVLAWRGAAENAFMTTAERAAAPLLPGMPARQPDAPGQFAFADPHRVRHILEEGGWIGVDIRPVDIACTMAEPDLLAYLTRLGPLGRILCEVDERTRAQVLQTVRAAFDPFVRGTEVHFDAACWMVAAKAGAVAPGTIGGGDVVGRAGTRLPER